MADALPREETLHAALAVVRTTSATLTPWLRGRRSPMMVGVAVARVLSGRAGGQEMGR